MFGGGDEGEGDDARADRNGASGFMAQYGWIYQATIVAEHQRIELDRAYVMPTVAFLNALAYLKAKGEHERQIREQQKRQG